MKIVALETLRPSVQSNVCFVRLYTDDGIVGLGETFYGSAQVERYLHEHAAPALMSFADASPQGVARELAPYVGYQGGGAELRGNSAIDIALWDLVGKQSGLPLATLLGAGHARSVQTYNTCAGNRYVSDSIRQSSLNWGLDVNPDGKFEDLAAFLTDPGALALELLDQGTTAMKIWPFDRAAERSGGLSITPDELRHGIGLVQKIRDACGERMDVMIELHGLWAPHVAAHICRALEPLAPYWIEDPVRPDALDGLASLRSATPLRLAMGETVAGRRGFLALLQRGVVDVCTVDVTWTGGLTEALAVAQVAEAFGVSIAPHDCTGPVSLAVATHLTASQPNGLIQESARAFIHGWYRDVAVGYPEPELGLLCPSTLAGHGVSLIPDLAERQDVHVEVSHVAGFSGTVRRAVTTPIRKEALSE